MKKNQRSIQLESRSEDRVQSLCIDTVKNVELSYNQVINMLVKEALQARGLL